MLQDSQKVHTALFGADLHIFSYPKLMCLLIPILPSNVRAVQLESLKSQKIYNIEHIGHSANSDNFLRQLLMIFSQYSGTFAVFSNQSTSL